MVITTFTNTEAKKRCLYGMYNSGGSNEVKHSQ